MSKIDKTFSALPSEDQLLDWIRDNPNAVSKREIAAAFGIKGAARVALKQMLADLLDKGVIERPSRRRLGVEGGRLPPVAVLRILGPDANGDLTATPETWESDAPPPRIFVPDPQGLLPKGARILAKMKALFDEEGRFYEGKLIRRLEENVRRVLGIYRKNARGGRLLPLERGVDELIIDDIYAAGAQDGELVETELLGNPRGGLKRAKVILRLGDPSAPRAVSLMAIHAHGIPTEFEPAALREAEAAQPLRGLEGRVDLRHVPFITIDPEDARDHDDAVFAEADPDPANPGGFIVLVAIADVAHYVRPGSALDREARRRGNSCYFPDRVVPMLPEKLSGDLCSLHEGAERPVIVCRMVLDARGHKRGHGFARALIRSAASLSYAQVEATAQGNRPAAVSAALQDQVIRPLYAAYHVAALARERRQPLDLDLPERQVELSPEGQVTAVRWRERLTAHRLIEEFMVLANVCAAETLEDKGRALLYRVHEVPSPEKIEELRDLLETVGIVLGKGQVLTTTVLNRALKQAQATEFAAMVNMAMLRAQTQAYYSPQNFGHFGLALRRYAHFTSPIRRYADLIVHRALIAAHHWGEDGQTAAEIAALPETAEHVSMTERRAMAAERDTTDRYLAAYLASRTGAEFEGRIAAVKPFGLFVRLEDTGADGLIPVSSLGREHFAFDEGRQSLVGERSRRVISLGQRCLVRLREAAPVTGGLLFDLLAVDDNNLPPVGYTSKRGRHAGPVRRSENRAASSRKAGYKGKPKPPGRR